MIKILKGDHSVPTTVEKRNKLAHCYTTKVYNVDLVALCYDIYQYLTKKEYPLGSSQKAQRAFRFWASQYLEDKGRLYKKTNMDINLLYVTQDKAGEIMKESSWWGMRSPHKWENASQKGTNK